MRRERLALVLLAGALLGLQGAAVATADLILNNGYGSYRVANDGTLVIGYDHYGFGETVDTHALTPDGKVLYAFTNNLGFTNHIVALNPDTDEHLPDKSIYLPFGFPLQPASVVIPSQALYRANDTHGLGALFVISGTWALGSQQGAPYPTIKRFNTVTKSYVETIDPPTGQEIIDFGFGLDGKMYVSTKENIYAYAEDPVQGFTTPAVPLIAGVHGNLAIGPDGNIYVNDPDTDTLDRYTMAGVLIGTFLPASAKVQGNITFDSNGNLYTYTEGYFDTFGEYVGAVGKYRLATGQLLSTTYDEHLLFPHERISVLPVPEPSSLLLVVAGILAAMGRRRARD